MTEGCLLVNGRVVTSLSLAKRQFFQRGWAADASSSNRVLSGVSVVHGGVLVIRNRQGDVAATRSLRVARIVRSGALIVTTDVAREIHVGDTLEVRMES